MHLAKTIALVATLLTSTAVHAQMFEQAYDPNGTAYASQYDTNGTGNFATTYDNFTLGSATTLTGLNFYGSYWNSPPYSGTTGFQIQIYDDNAGEPGAALWSTTIAGNGNESCDSSQGFPFCSYSVPLNFTADAGTQYWLSIVSELGLEVQWGWWTSTAGDGVSYIDFGGSRSSLETDFAFALFGTPAVVPEPSTWAMFLLGFGALGSTLRRKRKAALAVR